MNEYFEIHRDADGKITDLTPIPAEQVRIVRDRGGLIGFEVTPPCGRPECAPFDE